jgi:hypothetical protein
MSHRRDVPGARGFPKAAGFEPAWSSPLNGEPIPLAKSLPDTFTLAAVSLAKLISRQHVALPLTPSQTVKPLIAPLPDLWKVADEAEDLQPTALRESHPKRGA